MATGLIPKSRAVYLQAYTTILRDIGSPVDRWLAQARLPGDLEDTPEAYINVNFALDFIARAARAEGVDDFGWMAAQSLRPCHFSARYLSRANAAPTLLHRMRALIETSGVESPARVKIVPLDDRTRIVWTLAGVDPGVAAHPAEWQQIIAMVQVIRSAAGPDWVPSEIAFASRFDPSDAARAAMKDARLRFGQPETSITVPTALLAQPLHTPFARISGGGDEASVPLQTPDFVEDLGALLEPYLGAGDMHVGLAAEIAGTSVRTLQRRLGAHGISYSELVDAARFRVARRMLTQDNARIIDVSMAVGYDDPSNFSRTFKRIGGLSPRAFRAAAQSSAHA